MNSPGQPQIDLYNRGIPQVSQFDTRGGNRFRILRTFKHNGRNVAAWRLELRDLRGGLGRQTGDFDRDHDRTADSTLDTRHYRHLILPFLKTEAATPDPNTFEVLSSEDIFGLKMIAIGDGTGSLFKETSATNPAIVATTYAAGAGTPISCLHAVNWASATTAKHLLVGRIGAAAQTISAADGTVAATCHADVNTLWGAVPTFLPQLPILLYANGAIRKVNGTSAANTQPTIVSANRPNGGYAVGGLQLGGGTWRAYFVEPDENQASSMLTLSNEDFGKIIHYNSEGSDPNPLDMGIRIIQAVAVPDLQAIVAHDFKRVILHEGARKRDLRIFEGRPSNSNYDLRVTSLGANGPEIIAQISKWVNDDNTHWFEAWSPITGAWHKISAEEQETGSTSNRGFVPLGGLPLSKATRFMHTYDLDAAWERMYVATYGDNPFLLHRKTASTSTAGTGQEYESTGTWTSPYLELPGLEGFPKAVSRIIFMGDVDAGGTTSTPATVVWTAGGMGGNRSFITGFQNKRQVQDFPNNTHVFYQLQMTCTATRQSGGTDPTRFTPNALPVIVEGYAWLDDDIVSPGEVREMVGR